MGRLFFNMRELVPIVTGASTAVILALAAFKTVWRKNDLRHDMCLIFVATLLVGYHRVYDAVLLLFLAPMVLTIWTAGLRT